MAGGGTDETDELDLLRAQEYDLLAALLGRAPTSDVLERVSELRGDASPLGLAHTALAECASRCDSHEISREFFDLFIGVGRGEQIGRAHVCTQVTNAHIDCRLLPEKKK